jgi:hypothetical protein
VLGELVEVLGAVGDEPADPRGVAGGGGRGAADRVAQADARRVGAGVEAEPDLTRAGGVEPAAQRGVRSTAGSGQALTA